MFLEKLPIFLSLIAGLVVLIFGIVLNSGLVAVLSRLLIALISFYLMGIIIKMTLDYKVFPKPIEEELPDDNEAEGEGEDMGDGEIPIDAEGLTALDDEGIPPVADDAESHRRSREALNR